MNGSNNTAVGRYSLFSNTASGNSAIGDSALFKNTTGSGNTATGKDALHTNASGSTNTAIGGQALYYNTAGNLNTASGYDALVLNQNGSGNTANGVNALNNNTTGSNNTGLGYQAGHDLTTGDNNIDIGYNVVGVAGESNTIRIGNTDITDTFIRGISGATVASGAAVLVASNGHLGTMTSSKRFKDEIKSMDKASEALFALKPVTFRYKKELDPAGIQQFGLVAKDVEKVNPGLVVRDENGKVNSVRYEQVNAMLLNEFLKEHRKVEDQAGQIAEQKATIGLLREELAGLVAQMKEQEAKIDKVNSKLEMRTAAKQIALREP